MKTKLLLLLVLFWGISLTTSSDLLSQPLWTQVNNGLTHTDVRTLAVSGTNIFAGTDGGGVFLSTDNGTSWTAVNTGLTNRIVQSLAVSGTNLFAGTWGGGVFLSTDNGTNWTQTRLATTEVRSLAVSGTNLFAGNYGGGVWRRPLSDMVTSVDRLSADLPTHFSLNRNFPNPFNTTTVIRFSLPSRSFVSLKVFDGLGREVTLLVSEELPAGTYTRQWNATGLPSGVYFYRLEAQPLSGQSGSFMETKKLQLIR